MTLSSKSGKVIENAQPYGQVRSASLRWDCAKAQPLTSTLGLMATHPEPFEFGEEDLERTAQVVGRGLYFFDQLAPPIIDSRASDPHQICDVAYHIRSLAEVSSGMPLWFRSIENIRALSGATLIDFNHLLVRAFKAKRDAGKPLSEFEDKVLNDASDKYFALWYSDGKTQLKSHRSSDDCLIDTDLFTSKLLHQDEFSIFGSLGPGSIPTGVHLKKLANFWRRDFIAQCYFINSKFPQVISFHEQRYRPLPFKLEVFPNEA